MPEQEKEFFVETIFGAKTRQPLIRISYGIVGFTKEIAIISPENANELAMNLLQAAQASLTDAFLISFMEQRANADPQETLQLLRMFRDWRMGREEV
jgi:hypothetical protein